MVDVTSLKLTFKVLFILLCYNAVQTKEPCPLQKVSPGVTAQIQTIERF